jgi:mRNA-degrading endonuclease RelE of RelBE toxin-antitoxin system
MSFEIIPTPNFQKEAKRLSKKYFSFKSDLVPILENLQNNPEQGDVIFKNCYKIRFQIKSKNKGKSGGGRLVTLVKVVQNKVYLLSIFDKSDQETISDQYLKDILKGIEE